MRHCILLVHLFIFVVPLMSLSLLRRLPGVRVLSHRLSHAHQLSRACSVRSSASSKVTIPNINSPERMELLGMVLSTKLKKGDVLLLVGKE